MTSMFVSFSILTKVLWLIQHWSSRHIKMQTFNIWLCKCVRFGCCDINEMRMLLNVTTHLFQCCCFFAAAFFVLLFRSVLFFLSGHPHICFTLFMALNTMSFLKCSVSSERFKLPSNAHRVFLAENVTNANNITNFHGNTFFVCVTKAYEPHINASFMNNMPQQYLVGEKSDCLSHCNNFETISCSILLCSLSSR